MYKAFTFITFLFVSIVCSSAQQVEKKQWKDKITLTKIEINNQFGDVRLRYGGKGDNVEYIASIQQLDEKLTLYIERKQVGDIFHIIATYKTDSELIYKNLKSRIDMVIYIPEGRQISVINKDGLIEAKGLKSNIKLKSDSGLITAKKINGSINTFNNSGKTIITLVNNKTDKDQKFESVVGDISLLVNESLDFLIEMNTSGDIISDFSMIIEKDRNKEPSKKGLIKLNKTVSKLTFL